MNMLSGLGFEKLNNIILFREYTRALHVAGNSTYSARTNPRTNHITLSSFFLKKFVRDGKIALHHIPTQNQVADIATKCLPRTTIKYLIGLVKESAA